MPGQKLPIVQALHFPTVGIQILKTSLSEPAEIEYHTEHSLNPMTGLRQVSFLFHLEEIKNPESFLKEIALVCF